MLTAVVAVALLGFGALSSESAAEGKGHPADTTPRNTADPIPFDETAEWLGKLRTKANVSFVQSGVGRADQAQDKVVQKLTTLGPLNPEDRAAVEPLLASLVSLHQGSLLRFQQTMSSASIRDALEEAGLLLDVEVALAAQAACSPGITSSWQLGRRSRRSRHPAGHGVHFEGNLRMRASSSRSGQPGSCARCVTIERRRIGVDRRYRHRLTTSRGRTCRPDGGDAFVASPGATGSRHGAQWFPPNFIDRQSTCWSDLTHLAAAIVLPPLTAVTSPSPPFLLPLPVELPLRGE
jgi:hypothetical protein